MDIESAKYNLNNTSISVVIDGVTYVVPVDSGNSHYIQLLEWVAEDTVANVIEAADMAPPPPTDDERIDQVGDILFAFFKAYAKREGVTIAQLKSAIKAEL